MEINWRMERNRNLLMILMFVTLMTFLNWIAPQKKRDWLRWLVLTGYNADAGGGAKIKLLVRMGETETENETRSSARKNRDHDFKFLKYREMKFEHEQSFIHLKWFWIKYNDFAAMLFPSIRIFFMNEK